MPPDLVGVVIPAYIGALSSLAGVVVAVVALVTSRRARADARAAAAESGRVAEREEVTRGAVVELAGIAQEISAARPAPSAPEPAVAPAGAGGSGIVSGGTRRRAGSPRRRPVSPPRRSADIQDAVDRRPYWARTGPAQVVRSGGIATASIAPALGRTPVAGPPPQADVSDRLHDVIRRLSDDG